MEEIRERERLSLMKERSSKLEKKNKRRADEGQEMMSDSQLVVNLSSECIECKCIKIVRLKKLGRKESV